MKKFRIKYRLVTNSSENLKKELEMFLLKIKLKDIETHQVA